MILMFSAKDFVSLIISKKPNLHMGHSIAQAFNSMSISIEVMVKTKYLLRFSRQNYAWLLNYICTKTSNMNKLKR